MRMTAGLEVICSKFFYRDQLKPGLSTALDRPTRAVPRLCQGSGGGSLGLPFLVV